MIDHSKRYLLVISFVFGILFALGNPAVPLYTNVLGIDGSFVGYYFACNGFGLLVFAAIWGAIGDIRHRSKVIGIIFIGFAIGQFLFGFFSDKYLLLIASLISGIFFAGILVNIYSYINDAYKIEQERNKMLSYTVSCYLLGGAIAYLLGGYLADLFAPDYKYLFFVQAVLLVIVGVIILFKKVDLIDTDHHLSRKYFWNNMAQAVKLPWVPIYTITLTFFVSFAHNNVRRFLDYYVIDEGYSASELGLVVFAAGIAALLSNVFLAPLFMKKYHNFRFLQIQFLFAPILLFFSFYFDNLTLGLFTFYLGYTILLSVYEPTAISVMSENKAVSQGVLVGVRQTIVGLGMTAGFIIGGFTYQINHLYVFYLSVVFYIIVFVGFSILILLKWKDVKKYRQDYLEEAKK